MHKRQYLYLSCLLCSSIAMSSEYMAETAKQAPKPISPNLTKAISSDKDPEPTESDLIWKGVSSSFDMPFEEWDNEDEERSWLHGLSGNVSLGYPLLQTPATNLPANATTGPTNNNATATLSLKYTILGNWFVSK